MTALSCSYFPRKSLEWDLVILNTSSGQKVTSVIKTCPGRLSNKQGWLPRRTKDFWCTTITCIAPAQCRNQAFLDNTTTNHALSSADLKRKRETQLNNLFLVASLPSELLLSLGKRNFNLRPDSARA